MAERWNGRRWRIERIPNPAGVALSFLNAVACPSSSSCLAVGSSLTSSGDSVSIAEWWNGARWRLQRLPNPSHGGGSLQGVTCTSPTSCVAVGFSNEGTLAERWNGHAWHIQRTANPQGGGGLSGVACASPSRCTAVGGSQTGVLAERWNGRTWHIQPTPNPSGSQFGFLNGVSCSSRSACMAVGAYNNGSDFQTLAERWNGRKWTIRPSPSPGGAQGDFLFGVTCPSASSCIAMGFSHGSSTPLTMAQRWNGKAWRLQRAANASGAAEAQLNGVSCPGPSACMAVGNGPNGTLSERWNAKQWRDQPIPTVSGAALWAVSCGSASVCIAAGNSNSGTLAERWDGTRWRIQQTPTSTSHGGFNAISCSSAFACTAVGGIPSGPLAERWNGKRWKTQSVPLPVGTHAGFLTGISCPSASACIAVGIATDSSGNPVGPITEGWNGAKWSIQTAPNSGLAESQLGAVSCTTPSACTAVGGRFDSSGNPLGLIAERWNGTTWTVQATPSPAGQTGLSAVACAGPASCTAVGLMSTGLGGKVLAERWNGTRWQVQPTPFIPGTSIGTSSPPAVACPAPTTCTVVGGYEAPGPTSVTLAEQWRGKA